MNSDYNRKSGPDLKKFGPLLRMTGMPSICGESPQGA